MPLQPLVCAAVSLRMRPRTVGHTCAQDTENTKLGNLSRGGSGLDGRGWQKLNQRRCFETQVLQECGKPDESQVGDH
jgi:hypothetical protein